MIEELFISLIAIGAAEFGDKTQLSILLLSSKTKKHLQVLLGVMLSFLIVDGIAILVGSWITNIIPMKILKVASGIIFILFGILTLVNLNEKQKGNRFYKNPFVSAFLLIFLTEWGDKTQIAAALFATKYNTIMVIIGTLLALLILSISAIYFGKIISEKINKKMLNKIAGLIFIVLGITFFIF